MTCTFWSIHAVFSRWFAFLRSKIFLYEYIYDNLHFLHRWLALFGQYIQFLVADLHFLGQRFFYMHIYIYDNLHFLHRWLAFYTQGTFFCAFEKNIWLYRLYLQSQITPDREETRFETLDTLATCSICNFLFDLARLIYIDHLF